MHIHIRQEVHFYHAHAAAFTNVTAATFYVEGKSSGIVTTDLCLWNCGEQRSDLCKKSAIGCRIASRCTADRRLVYFNNLVYMFKSLDAFKRHRGYAAVVTMFGKDGIQGFIDQRGLAT